MSGAEPQGHRTGEPEVTIQHGDGELHIRAQRL